MPTTRSPSLSSPSIGNSSRSAAPAAAAARPDPDGANPPPRMPAPDPGTDPGAPPRGGNPVGAETAAAGPTYYFRRRLRAWRRGGGDRSRGPSCFEHGVRVALAVVPG